jgi:hypothetical protein
MVAAGPRLALTLAAALLAAPVARADSKPKPPKPVLLPPPKADDSLAPARVDSAMLDRSYKRAQNTRNLGIGLAAPGVALSILGGVLIGFGSTSPNLFDQVDKIIAGVITCGGGLIIGIPGVYFWSTGQDDMDSVVWRRKQLTSSSP